MTKADALMYWLQPLRKGAEIQDLIVRGMELGLLSRETGMRLLLRANDLA